MNYPNTKYIKKMAAKWAEERLLLPVILVKFLGSERCYKLEVPKADVIRDKKKEPAQEFNFRHDMGWNKETSDEIMDRIKQMGDRFYFNGRPSRTYTDQFGNINFGNIKWDPINGISREDYLEQLRRNSNG